MNALLAPNPLTDPLRVAGRDRVCVPDGRVGEVIGFSVMCATRLPQQRQARRRAIEASVRTPMAGSRLMAFRRAPESFELRRGPQPHDADVFDLLRIEP